VATVQSRGNRMRRVALVALSAVAASVCVVTMSACEGNRLFMGAQVAAHLDAAGRVEVLTYTCANQPVTSVVAQADKAEPSWTTSTTTTNEGLIRLPADGSDAPGWATAGSLDPKSRTLVVVYVHKQGGDTQSLQVTPARLSTDSLSVAPYGFAGEDHVSEAEFVKVNQGWCAR
jgi:hypothetical protein